MLLVPIMNLHGRAVGILQLVNRQGQTMFDDADEALARGFAGICGFAISLQQRRILTKTID